MVDRYLAHGNSLGDLRALIDRCDVVCTTSSVSSSTTTSKPRWHLPGRCSTSRRRLGAGICAANVAAPLGDELVSLANQCADILDPAGVRLTFEFTPIRPIDSIPKTRSLCEQIGWDRVGVTLDPWHFFRGPDTWDTLRQLQANEITLVQFDDALPAVSDDFFAETRLRRVMPGDGEFDLVTFTTAVREIGFDGIVSPEILSPDLRGPRPRRVCPAGDGIHSEVLELRASTTATSTHLAETRSREAERGSVS